MAGNNTGGSFLDRLLGGIKFILRNGFELPQRSKLNFIGFPAVLDNPSLGTTDVYGTSGSTGGGITIIENNGVAMPAESALNFVGFVLGDDPGNSRTNVALPSPGTTAVANGGTGRTSLTAHSVLLGEGASPIGFAVPTSSGFVLTDQGPGADPIFAPNPAANVATTSSFTQPSVGSSVSVQMTSTALLAPHGQTTLIPGGRYSVSTITDGTHAVLINRGGPPNVSPTTVVNPGALVSLQAPNALETLHAALSMFALFDCVNALDPQFGVVGDGVADDLAALNAAKAVALATGRRLRLPRPPVAYGLSAAFQITGGLVVEGDAILPGQVELRALAGNTTGILDVFLTGGATPPGDSFSITPAIVRGLSFNANNVCADNVNLSGAWFCRFEHCYAYGAQRDQWHQKAFRTPPTLSSVTQSGTPGSPAMTVALPDSGYCGITATATINIKCTVPGALNTARFVADFGSGYQTADQKIAAGTNRLCVTSFTTYQYDSGITLAFGSGTFNVGTIWTFTVTVTNQPQGGSGNVNADMRFEDCWALNGGQAYATATLFSAYASFLPNVTNTLTGTVTVSLGAQLMTGSGTNFLSNAPTALLQSRYGDNLYAVGLGPSKIACVLNDFEIALREGAIAAVAGADYALSCGQGYHTDRSSDPARPTWSGGRVSRVPEGMFLFAGSDGGMTLDDDPRIELYGFAGLTVDGQGFANLNNVELKTSIGQSKKIILVGGSTSSMLGVNQNVALASDMAGGGSAIVQSGAVVLPKGFGSLTMVPLGAVGLAITPATLISSAGQQLSQPSFNNPVGQGAYVPVTLTASMTSTAAPLIPAPLFNPNLAPFFFLQNISNHAWTLKHDFISGSGLILPGSKIRLGPNEGIWLFNNGVDTKYRQVGPAVRDYVGVCGVASRDGGDAIQTTNATPVTFYPLDADGFAGAQSLQFVVSATNGSDAAWWYGKMAWKLANPGVQQAPVDGMPHFDDVFGTATGGAVPNPGGGAPWSVTWITTGGQGFCQVTGDASGTAVNWSIAVNHDAAPRLL